MYTYIYIIIYIHNYNTTSWNSSFARYPNLRLAVVHCLKQDTYCVFFQATNTSCSWRRRCQLCNATGQKNEWYRIPGSLPADVPWGLPLPIIITYSAIQLSIFLGIVCRNLRCCRLAKCVSSKLANAAGGQGWPWSGLLESQLSGMTPISSGSSGINRHFF